MAAFGCSLRPKSGSIIYVLDPHWLVRLLKQHEDRKDASRDGSDMQRNIEMM
jgi:hypothetical protein